MRAAFAVAGVAAAAYLPSLWGVFHFDDYNVIVHYDTVHSWSALAERWGGGVRPLLKASYTLNWTLGGGFHLLNIASHALNALLLFLIGEELFRDRRAALIAALLSLYLAIGWVARPPLALGATDEIIYLALSRSLEAGSFGYRCFLR